MSLTTFLSGGMETASVIIALPGALAALEVALPTMESEGKALWTAVYTPAKALYADVQVIIKGGSAQVASENAGKSVTDASSLFSALVAALPTAKTDLSGLYTTLLPVFQPIAEALGKTLPAAIFVPAATPAPAAA